MTFHIHRWRPNQYEGESTEIFIGQTFVQLLWRALVERWTWKHTCWYVED
jgi:hypothetical protein